ncbi:MAG: LPS-assembly protein LptD [Candidatus Zixiibacteriota bacterium]|nr:MAG: LPS-assembly protein LptD [candidate division Zixibacteria bacterium]
MLKRVFFLCLAALLSLYATLVVAERQEKLILDHADQFEVVLSGDRYITYVVGHVSFKTETGTIYCDSARWLRGESVTLNGNVFIDDAEYQLRADSTFYDVERGEVTARGKRVELWSYKDSLYAVGTHAFFAEKSDYFFMEQRPVVYIGYPDTAKMIEVIAETVQYDATTKVAQAREDVKISSAEFATQSGCAVMHTERNLLDLFEGPVVRRGESVISGGLVSIQLEDEVLSRIDVVDSARGDFKEPVDTLLGYYDESTLTGRRIILDFDAGELAAVTCYGQAYSWYYPSPQGGSETHQNSVSGDTIRFTVENEQLQKVNVVGGAVGRYIATKPETTDSLTTIRADTVDYTGDFIEYHIVDSLITLQYLAHVESGPAQLDAHEISFDTRANIIEAYSAFLDRDTVGTRYSLSAQLQPNSIPVILKDRAGEVYGDYLLYSIDTEKGRIIQSKSDYEAGLYYGKKLFREQRHIFYVNDGRYTTCDASEPHFHFHSSSMKLIEDEKLIARPVVFYIERLPIAALPYYVFPLKKGRHSGFLPFSWGKFERGERYVRDVGYFWAASDYWDWQGSFDYHEVRRTLAFKSRVNFRKRYVLDGDFSGSYARETGYNRAVASETRSNRWTLRGSYRHDFTPSFTVRANGDFQSDKAYYTDYSQNLAERLNRNTKSQVSFAKKFGNGASLTGNITHNVDLDRESRVDNIPNLSLSLPQIFPFGSGGRDEQGTLKQSWYQKTSLQYSPRLENYSSRITIDSAIFDTVIDSSQSPFDTTIVTDTLSRRSRVKYTKLNHNPRLTLPQISLGDYMNLIPRINYAETWIKVHRTDSSDALGIDASEFYRTYSWNAGLTANTRLYGTVYPNLYGLVGLRHVITPSVGYTYSPEIDRHPEIRRYVRGGAGSSKSSRLNFSLQHLFQAKYRKDEAELNKDLLSITSRFGYDFEVDDKPWSNMTTTLQSSALPIISSLSGSMAHSFYDPDTDELDFWSPTLLSFSIDARLSLRGSSFLFDEGSEIPRGVDSASQLSRLPARPAVGGRGKGWNLSVTYRYEESGRGASWRKSSFVNLNLNFNLTPTTSIAYSQRYDIARDVTVYNSVNIIKKIHCWSGSLYWVPIGSNRGFGFKLFVTAIPDIKIDSNHDGFFETLQQ